MDTPPLHAVSFIAPAPGAALLFLGAVHGDETCGAIAIERIIAEFKTGALMLQRGSVTFIPICNPAAFRLQQRQVEKNLNRVFGTAGTSYEERMAGTLKPYLNGCDYLVDLHSYRAPIGSPPFGFIDPSNQPSLRFATHLFQGIASGFYVSNFAAAIAASGYNPTNTPVAAPMLGTVEYARLNAKNGGKGAIALTVECGGHADANGAAVAYQVMLNALGYLGLITHPTAMLAGAAAATAKHIQLDIAVYRTDAGGTFTQAWKNFTPLKAGTPIATRTNGEVLHAAQDCYIVLPDDHALAGAEWYYLGREAPLTVMAKANMEPS